MAKSIYETFRKLVQQGLNQLDKLFYENLQIESWTALEALATQQGLLPLVADGLESIPKESRPPKDVMFQWIGLTIQQEKQYSGQLGMAMKLSQLYQRNFIRTYVIKGIVLAECYPIPSHRFCSDLDCYLLPSEGSFDAWSLGNDLVRTQGYEVNVGYYKNSTFHLPGLMVENHRFMVPFRGNKKLARLERVLRGYMLEDKGEDIIEGTCLYRPPIIVSSLFLIEHAYSHFLHEGLTWRHVLDWMLFSKKHQNEIDWGMLDSLIDEFGFRKFYDSYSRMGQYLLGEVSEDELTKPEKKMLEDVWAPLDLHETLHGVKGKLALAGNTWRARWKYRYFGDISMLCALCIQVWGYLFVREPRLE